MYNKGEGYRQTVRPQSLVKRFDRTVWKLGGHFFFIATKNFLTEKAEPIA